MLQTVEGRIILKNKPIISTKILNLPKLRGNITIISHTSQYVFEIKRFVELPLNSLGREYVAYIDKHGFSPDERTLVRFITDPDNAYVMARYRQIHDFWHVLADLPPSLLGEISLKAFEFQVCCYCDKH